MRKLRIILTIILATGFFVGLALFLIGYLRPKEAGILVESNPSADVYIDGLKVGKTPYEGTKRPGEIIIKLIPNTPEKNLIPFESKITLSSGIKTIVRRDFGDTEEKSASEIISFEKVGGKESFFSVITTPDSAQISLDGSIKGFTPIKKTGISQGPHQLIVSLEGYIERTISIVPYPGYRLVADIKLAKSDEKAPDEAVKESVKKIFVEILPTETNFLRVRDNPKNGIEVAQVKPGEKYPLLEEDSKTGWYKIEISKTEAGETVKTQGWVSNQFAKKVEELDSSNAAI